MNKITKVIQCVIKWIILIVVIIIVELLAPLTMLILPLYVYRLFVWLASKVLKSDFGAMLSGLSAINASDDTLKRPTYTILLYDFTEGHVDLKHHQQLWMDKVVNVKLPNGKLKYPELQQFVTNWGGFQFWKQDKKFDIKNHIMLYSESASNITNSNNNKNNNKSNSCNNNHQNGIWDGIQLPTWDPNEPWNEEFVASFGRRLLKKLFKAKRSPWEILILHDRNKAQSLIFIRYHHSLADGFAITQLLSNVSYGEWFQDSRSNYKLPAWKKALCMILFPYITPIVMLPAVVNYMDNNEWVRKAKKPTERVNYAVSNPIQVKRIKQIKNSLGVSFYAVLFAAFTGAIRNYMMLAKTAVPKQIHVGIPLPIPGRPDKLTNHVTGGLLKLPTGLSSPMKRLQYVEREIGKVRKSLVPKFCGMFGQIYLGAMPTFLIKLLRRLEAGTASISLFPGPPEMLVYKTGERILTLGAVLDFAIPGQAVMIGGVTYAGILRFYIGVDESVISNLHGLRQLTRLVDNELDLLEREQIAVV